MAPPIEDADETEVSDAAPDPRVTVAFSALECFDERLLRDEDVWAAFRCGSLGARVESDDDRRPGPYDAHDELWPLLELIPKQPVTHKDLLTDENRARYLDISAS